MKGIYERTDSEITRRESRIRELEKELSIYKQEEIPYAQITKEIHNQYPDITNLYIGRGASVDSDSLKVNNGIMIVAGSDKPIKESIREKLENWLQIRLNDSTVTVITRTNKY